MYFEKKGGAVNYRRMAVFTFLVLLALLIPGALLAGLLGLRPLTFGVNAEQAGARFWLIDHVLTGVAAVFAYIWLLWPVTKRPMAHCVVVFLAAEIVQSLAGFAFGNSPRDVFVWQAFLRDATYAALGLVLTIGWRLVSRRAVA